YGSTPSGISAAVNAASEGASVILLEPTGHFGGLVTGGMSNPDFKTFEALSGFYLDFMQRVVNYYEEKYGEDSRQVKDSYHGVWYEPHVAKEIFTALIEDAGVELRLQEQLTEAVIVDGKIESIITSSEDQETSRFNASVFIDATYEGDLMALAGCDFRVGRESRAEYGELYAGKKFYDGGKFLIGSTGEGDHRIQCYNFRLCMTDDPAIRVPVPKPQGYDRSAFLPLLELLKSGKITGFVNELIAVNRIPNGKADINDKMYSLYSLRLPGENYDWPNGGPLTRQKIFERHKSYTLGFLYFLQNDPEVPDKIREETSEWGFAKDEFPEYDHFSPALYVREGRRLKADFVLTEQDLLPTDESVRSPLKKDAIAICDYSMDSHGNTPPSSMHPDITEGVFNAYVVPYQIPYSVMVPKEVDGLLVTCAVSASHVAFSSLRMEPTWCALGQAAGMAAAMSLDGGLVRKVDISILQQKLHQKGCMTVYVSDISPDSPHFEAVQYFGTQGFFNDLPEYKDVPHIGRGGKGGLPGQFILKYPYHDLSPDKILDKELAMKWTRMAGISIDRLQWTPGKTTRIEFLNKMYSQIEDH
ncbi:MAG: FAD-dependent oxidoreductase, partial [Cyclobacteriaceae bacterium]